MMTKYHYNQFAPTDSMSRQPCKGVRRNFSGYWDIAPICNSLETVYINNWAEKNTRTTVFDYTLLRLLDTELLRCRFPRLRLRNRAWLNGDNFCFGPALMQSTGFHVSWVCHLQVCLGITVFFVRLEKRFVSPMNNVQLRVVKIREYIAVALAVSFP